MRHLFKSLPNAVICSWQALCIFALLGSGAATGQEVPGQANRATHVEGQFAPAPDRLPAQPTRRLHRSPPALQVILDRVNASRLAEETASIRQAIPGVPLKIGFSRDVPMLASTSQTTAALAWVDTPTGQLAAISITSPEAGGLRLGLRVESIPATALLRFFAQGADTMFEVSGQDIMAAIRRNTGAGDHSDDARSYWSPVIEGQEVTVEIELPTGVSAADVKFSIPRVSHLFSSPLNTRALPQPGQSTSCELDSVCYQPPWANESLATAILTFTSGGASYLCTGTLLNDSDPTTLIPYVLTANHCISTLSAASSVQSYWFYHATSCNSPTANPGTQTVAGGATLLYASSATDTSFIRLNSAPPSGVYYAGWSSSLPAWNSAATGIHHPRGDLQKISFASVADYAACIDTGAGQFSCTSAPAGSATHLQVAWSQGLTEPGSSGSGLWATSSGGSHYLVGQLHGGASSCPPSGLPDFYGRFDVAYNAALSQWLGVTMTAPVCALSATPASIAAGASATLTAACTPTADSYTWTGGTCAGINAATCTVTPAATTSYSVAGVNSSGTGPASSATVTVTATVAPSARLINLSTRGQVQTGSNVLIGGFIIGGAAPKTVLVRAGGPNLLNYGVTGVLADPMLQLYSGQTMIASNNNWQTATNKLAIQATGLAPVNPLESAILTSLNPGAYTAIVSGVNHGTGVGLVEVFEVDHPEIPLINMSTRGLVQTGSNVLIGGFIIQGSGPQTVLLRAVGPNLANYGVTGVLADPKLDLYAGPNIIASNDNWQTATNAAAIQATGLAPASPLESAILMTLSPGPYTAILSGIGGGTGVGIVEVFVQ